ncbi:MAG TPA: hypothetical protein VF661_09560 [Actinomycetales bacterium]|jgi:hypothetical protein
MRLAQHPCRAECGWVPDPRRALRPRGAPPLFRCTGCGSQWDRTEGWTPSDADGTVSPLVQTEASRRAAG